MTSRRRTFLAAAAVLVAAAPAWAQAQADQPDEGGRQEVREKARCADGELEGKLVLFFRNALTGKPVSGASITLESETAQTGKDGSVTFDYPEAPGDEITTITASFRKKGFVSAKIPMLFRLGSHAGCHYSVSPVLPPGNMRIVLDWSDKPLDLDAHLVKEPGAAGGTDGYHISYRDMRKAHESAQLDRDDTDGFGPETITVMQIDPKGSYAFFVHDYTNRENGASQGLKGSGARVTLFTDTGVEKAFFVPAKAGNHWTVFFLRGGGIVESPKASSMGAAPMPGGPAAP